MSQQNNMEWIKCIDALPNQNGKYLAWDGKDINFQYFENGYFLMSVGLDIRYCNIPFSHWMPLPKPPNPIIELKESLPVDKKE